MKGKTSNVIVILIVIITIITVLFAISHEAFGQVQGNEVEKKHEQRELSKEDIDQAEDEAEKEIEREIQEKQDQMIDEPEMQDLEKQWMELSEEMEGYMPQIGFGDLLDMVRGEDGEFQLNKLFFGLINFFLGEITANLSLLGKVMVLSVIAALLVNLQTAFSEQFIGDLAHKVVYLLIMSIALQSFFIALNIGREAVQNMVDVILALIPLLLSLMASMGAVTSVAIFHPISIFLINTFSALIRNVVFPLLVFSAVLNIISHLSPHFKVTRLAGLFKDISIGALGFFMTIFLGVMGLQGIGGAVVDGISIRTAKFLTGTFIPVVGKSLADAVETVVGASLVLTNSITIAGAALIFFTAVFPALKILALVFIYKIAASLLEPLGDDSIPDSLNTMANCLTFVFAGVAIVGFMFFVALAVIMGAANASMMIRG
ncbi:stage III sporulation protein AE [Natranaerofaba carboxydovora]|uniref:stage III sporulation protein AE n=1 Tax=Natranaerofaba carboxydovora TaxID=2742683 RepID=UPI001F146260|nr:stage III sporulation protein AE [Natranaerofaba carboxydovora]UMZ73959.1 Stage III sporulation protein AE [Natranaerofaba carboxydovora]